MAAQAGQPVVSLEPTQPSVPTVEENQPATSVVAPDTGLSSLPQVTSESSVSDTTGDQVSSTDLSATRPDQLEASVQPGLTVPTQPGFFRDEETGVGVQLSGQDRAKNLSMVVHPKSVVDVTVDDRLAGLELELYDIYFVAPDGAKSQITSPAQVILPVSGLVDGVYYIAPTGLSEALPFTQVDDQHVRIEVTHFSYYGVAYRKKDAVGNEQRVSAIANQSSHVPAPPTAAPVAIQPGLPKTGEDLSSFIYAAGLASLTAGLGLAYRSKPSKS